MSIVDIQQQLLRDEGLRLKPYTDTVGKLTIGVGRNLTDNGISQAEALVLLQDDIASTEVRLKAALPWVSGMDEARYGALLNMAFNLGVAGLLEFRKMLAAMQDGDWGDAAEEMTSSRWAEQVGPRAVRLALQMRTGIWQ